MLDPLLVRRALESATPVRWAATLAAIAFIVRLPVFRMTFVSGDEAIYSALASALLDGHRFYAGAVDHKPPLLVAVYAVLQVLTGTRNIHVVHAVSILAVIATAGLLSSVAGRFGLSVATRRASALLYVLAASTGPAKDMLAANGEVLMALPAVAAVWVALKGLRPGAGAVPWCWLAAGVSASIAALFKYQGLAILAPIAVLAASGGRMGPFCARMTGLLVGIAVPPLLLLAWYGSAGELESLGFWMWTYPLRYAGTLDPGLVAENAVKMSVAWGLLQAGLLFAAIRCRPAAGSGPGDREAHAFFGRFVVVWVAGALAGVAAGGRFFLHYYLQLLPPLCLLAARGFRRMAGEGGARRAFACAALFVLLPLGGSWIVNVLPERFHPERVAEDAIYRRIGDFVIASTKPSESLFVWGNSPEIYYYARRPPGTRFVFCNYHSGKIWGTPSDRADAIVDPSLVLEPAWGMLLSDLDRRRPALIVDAASAGLDRWRGHEIARYPSLSAVVASSYRLLATVAGADIYERLDRGARGENPGLREVGK